MKRKIIVSSLRSLETINVVMKIFFEQSRSKPMSDIATNESMQYLI
jgi:hypothetical protein